MFTHERHRLIADLVAREQRLTVQEIHRQINVSPATLRRDLTEMEKAGLLVRVHGGVVHPQALRSEPSFSLKSRRAVEAKRAIAGVAVEGVPDGAVVFVDSGTTCLEVGRRLLTRGAVKVVTNSAPLLAEAHNAGLPIVALGGELRPISGALTGLLALEWLARLRINYAFLGASGLGLDGVATTELSEAAVKTAVLQNVSANAGRRVLAADTSKWNATALVRFGGWEDFDLWITSGELPAEAHASLCTQKIEIVNAPAPSSSSPSSSEL